MHGYSWLLMYHFLNFQLDDLYMSQPNCITFAAGMPNVATYPVEDISVTYKHDNLIRFSRNELTTALQYGSTQG